MNKKEHCCNMTFELGKEHCENCSNYMEFIGSTCSLDVVVQDNEEEFYKDLVGVHLRLWKGTPFNDFKIMFWNEKDEEQVMKAFFKPYEEEGLCETWAEHVSRWNGEDYDEEEYSLGYLFIMPLELTRVLNNDELAELTKSYGMK